MSKYMDDKESFLEPKVKQYGSHMIMSNVQKSTKQKYINIDTRFRDDYTSEKTENPNIQLNESYASSFPQRYSLSLPEKINDVKSMMICNVEIPMSFYNISKNLGNHAFTVKKGTGNPATITVHDGQYTNATLVVEVNARLTTAGFTDLLFDISNNFVKFQNTSLSEYQIMFDVDSTGQFDKYNFKSKIGWLMGFRQLTYRVSTATTLSSEKFVDLNGPRYLYLAIDEFSKGNQQSFVSPLTRSLMNKNIIAKIVLNKTIYPFSNATILPANLFNGYLLTDRRNYAGKIDLQRLSIQLVNEYGIAMDLNGMDFSFCIEVEHE